MSSQAAGKKDHAVKYRKLERAAHRVMIRVSDLEILHDAGVDVLLHIFALVYYLYMHICDLWCMVLFPLNRTYRPSVNLYFLL